MKKISSSNLRIMVVEDSADIRDLVGRFYQTEGYEVEVAADGAEALVKLRARADLPCLLLLDLMMPGMNGFDFRAEQLKDPVLSGIPVVIMTADANAERKAKILKTRGFVKKPVGLETLIAVANKYCGNCRFEKSEAEA